VLLLLGLSLVACGDEGSDPAADRSSSTVTTNASTTTPVAPNSTVAPTTAAPTTGTTAPGLSDESKLRFDGIGPIQVGMTLASATAAVGRPVTVDPRYVLEGCAYATVQGGPDDLSFMVLRDNDTDPWRIVRVNVNDKSRIATLSGVRIGATEAEVKDTYSGPDKTGKVATEQHAYVEEGHYITYDVDGPEGLLLLFETDGTKVTEFRSGEQGPVGYVEGCA
jgi:hypothetical protein